MTFGEAVEILKAGGKVARSGWNGKGMHLYLERPREIAGCVIYEPCIVMYTAQGRHQPGWLASQSDILADDWSVVS